jgi:O-antigen/teichoic acid export membrane protein
MLRKILSHSAIYGLAPHVPKIAGIFTLPIITKYLTDIDYGIAGTIAAYTGAISVFSTLGMHAVLTISFYKYEYHYKWIWRQIYGFLQYWMIVFALLQGIFLYFIIPEEANENRWTIIFLANLSTVFFASTALIGSMHYRMLQKPAPIAVRNIIAGLITVFANLIFVAHFKMGYMGWYVSSFIASCFVNISYWWTVHKTWRLTPIYKLKWNMLRKYLNIALPIVPHFYSGYLLNSSNRLIMDRLNIPINIIGKFNLASQFGGYFDMFVGAINMAISPMTMDEIQKNNENMSKKIILFMSIIVFSSTFLFSLWSKEILLFLIKNSDLQKIYPLVIILVMAYNYRPMYIAATNMFFYYENTKNLLKVSLVAGILSLIGYLIVTPLWGLYGIAIVNFIFLQYMGYSGFFMKEYKEKTKVSYPYLQILGITLLLTFIVFFMVELSWIIKIGVTISILCIALCGVKKLNLK